MKHGLLAVVLACALPGLVRDAAQPAPIHGTWRCDAGNYWNRDDNERWVSIQLERDDSHNSLSVAARDVPALADASANGPIHFTVRRDAGLYTFDGSERDGQGAGDFVFAPDTAYISDMARLGYQGLTGDDVWRFATFDITRDYVTGFKNAGYTLDRDELIKTRIHGATPTFVEQVRQEGLGHPPIDDLVRMRIHGVTPEFIKAFSDLGYKNLDSDQLVAMRIHGVTPEFVKALGDLGYTNIGIDDLVKMRIHGVTPEYIREMRDVGYGKEGVDQLVAFRIHGVTPDFVRDLESHGFKNLSADDLVDASIHGRRWLRSR